MTFIEHLAYIDSRLRYSLSAIHPYLFTGIYTYGRKYFLHKLISTIPRKMISIPESASVKLWGIKFQSSLFNAAGMFKSGEGYRSAAMQGAGAFLAGTTTAEARSGNNKHLIMHPFVPYTKAHSASNWMGLPNEGHAKVARRLAGIEKINGCPVGASIAAQPGQTGRIALNGITEGLELYQKAGVDFVELNESCPNVLHDKCNNCNGLDTALIERMEYLSINFLKKRKRSLPVIIKLSNDTDISQMPALLDIIITLGFDGINLGNTSTDYENAKKYMDDRELPVFEYFTKTFGGGVSGKPLKEKSFLLAKAASEYLQSKIIDREFHVIRTGGIESANDVLNSRSVGIELNQWFTGYFEQFSNHGFNCYKNIFDKM